MVEAGNTKVLCTASYTDKRPGFLYNTNSGWISAEYSMLPHATHERSTRESHAKPRGRSMEIQRLIARTLRCCCDLEMLQQKTILIDCDVVQADGSTRTHAINGAFVALSLTIQHMMQKGILDTNPIRHQICAIACALQQGTVVHDPTYANDSQADADINLVFTHHGSLIEIQGTGERQPMAIPSFDTFLQEAFAKTQHIRQAQIGAIARGQTSC